jgi:hypothetical protein
MTEVLSMAQAAKNTAATRKVRVVLPGPLRQLARISGDLTVDAAADAEGRVTQRALLDANETRYPMLKGTMRDQDTKIRRAYVRFYGCERDLSPQSADTPVPDAIAEGREPFLVVGALAGG